jgi:hypothetical protein
MSHWSVTLKSELNKKTMTQITLALAKGRILKEALPLLK